MNLHSIRQICLILLPLIFVLSIMLHFWLDVGIWSEYFYIISLTANIGYFTNFIAIKMLFKPYQKTVLGRHGLIPKNQSKLAKVLSGTLNQHFLASEHWSDYLIKAQVIPKLLANTQQYCEQWVDKPENLAQIFQMINQQLLSKENNLQAILQQLQTEVLLDVSSKMDVEDILKQLIDWIENQFEDKPQQMIFLIEPVIKTLAENIPQIARQLIKKVDQHIEEQDVIKRNIAKAVIWSTNLSEEDVKEYLFRMVASAEFRQTLFQGLQSIIQSYKQVDTLESANENQIQIKSLIRQILEQQSQSLNLSKIVIEFINQPSNLNILSTWIKKSLPSFFNWLSYQLKQSKIEKAIHQQIIILIESIDLDEVIEEKASQFSPQKMEIIFQSMISDQLVFIELLGALLGALSGFALIDFKLFLGLSFSLLGYYALDVYLTARKN